MSSAGINPLAIFAPDLYAKQIAIQRRQALAGALLGDQMAPGSSTQAYSGLANAGNRILGAFLARGADKDMAGLYSQPQQAQQPADIGQVSNTPVQPTTPLPQPGEGVQPPQGQMTQPQQMGAQMAPQQPQVQQQGAPAPQTQQLGAALQGQQLQQTTPPRTIPGALQGSIATLPGMSAQQSMLEFVNNNDAYWKALNANNALTDVDKQVIAAYPGNPQAQLTMRQAIEAKAGSIDLRDMGGAAIPQAGGGYSRIYGPNENANTFYTTGPNGEPVAQNIQGGPEAAANTAGLVEAAKEANKIIEVNLADGRTVPMRAGDAVRFGLTPPQPQGSMPSAGAPPPANINANNPLNMQPGGSQARYVTPTAGFGTAWDNLGQYGQQGINTVSGIVKKWAPAAPPEYASNVAQKLKVDPNQPLNMNDPNVKGQLIDAMQPNETGSRYQSPASPQIGVSTAQGEINKATGGAAVANAKTQSTAQATLAAIDGLISLNDKTPDSTVMSPEWKADINRRIPGVFNGDAGALAQWNQLSGINVLGGLKTLQGLGRLDLPEVNQVVKTNGVSPDLPRAQRIQILQNLKTAIQNNLGVAQSNVANLNQPNIAAQSQTVPMKQYGTPGPQDIVDELRRRGVVK